MPIEIRKAPIIPISERKDGDLIPPQRPQVGRLALDTTGVFNNHSWNSPPAGIEGTFSIESEDGSFELTLTDSLHQAVQKRGFTRTREDFKALITQTLAEPFGAANIDHFVDTPAGQALRVVHKVTGSLEDLLGDTPLAIKGTGLDMEQGIYLGAMRAPLKQQFRNTLFMNRKFKEHSPKDGLINGLIGVNDVYGVVAYRGANDEIQEWMLMEHVQDAEPVINEEVSLNTFRGQNQTLGFNAERYPELANLVDPFGIYRSDNVLYKELAETVNKTLGIWGGSAATLLNDLNGNNILQTTLPNGSHRYTIIDVQSH